MHESYEWVEFIVRNTNTIGGCQYVEEDIHILPRTTWGYVSFQHSTHATQEFNSTHYKWIFDLNPGSSHSWSSSSSSSSSSDVLQTIRSIDSIEVNGIIYQDVLQTRWIHYYWSVQFSDEGSIDSFYANEHGLVRMTKIHDGNSDTINVVDHYMCSTLIIFNFPTSIFQCSLQSNDFSCGW